MTISRRQLLAGLAAAPLLRALPVHAIEASARQTLKDGYARRLKRLLADGALPYIDLESSCNSRQVDPAAVAAAMDRLKIGMMALSADPNPQMLAQPELYDPLAARLLQEFPQHFIPVGNGGQEPATTDQATPFLAAQQAAAERHDILMFGEYEFRHYPSPRQARRGDEDRDSAIALDGPLGESLFALSEKTGLAFQIHYEIEDALLPALEQMLARYPKATVIWCHLAQIRYIERASRYSPAYVNDLLTRFPNLYFDTAFGSAKSVYPVSGQRQARVWADDGSLKSEWRDVITAHPSRFVAALDLGQDRLDKIDTYDGHLRHFLAELPDGVRQQVAYGNAWRLLFGETFG